MKVRRRLVVLGIDDLASIMHLAGSIEELRSVAPEIRGGGFGNGAWFALVSVWGSSSVLGRQVVQQRGLRHADPLPPVPPAAVVVPAAPRPAFPLLLPPIPLVSATAHTARSAATLAVISVGKRPLAATSKPPPMGANLSGRAELSRRWEKVLVQCRKALVNFGSIAPRFEELYIPGGGASPAHLQV